MIKKFCDSCGSEDVVATINVTNENEDLFKKIKFSWMKLYSMHHVCPTCLNEWFDTLSKSMRNKLNYDNKQE